MAGHEMLAALTGVSELQIETGEGRKLGEALQRVLKLKHSSLSPEKLAYIHLATTLGTIYGPRALAWRLRVNQERKSYPKPNVRQMPGPGKTAGAQPSQAPAAAAGTGTAGPIPENVLGGAWYEPAKED